MWIAFLYKQCKYSLMRILVLVVIPGFIFAQQKIDRQALVERHTIVVSAIDPLASLSVGNGAFAFTVDVTGLQTFPEFYKKGVPLGTQSEWGWHSFPNNENFADVESLQEYILEEAQLAPTKTEVENFITNIQTLQEKVERLEARIAAIKQHKKFTIAATTNNIQPS